MRAVTVAPVQVDHIDLAVAHAGDVSGAIALDRDPERIGAAGLAAARLQRNLRCRSRGQAVCERHQRQRVIVEVRHHQPAAIGGDRKAASLGFDAETLALGMAELDRRSAVLGPAAAFGGEDMDNVIHAARDIEMPPVGGEGEAHIAVGNPQRLDLPGRALGDVEDEDIFVGGGGDGLAARVGEPVIAAGQDQQGLAVGADGGGDRLAGGVAGKIRQMGIEADEAGARRRQGRDAQARRRQRRGGMAGRRGGFRRRLRSGQGEQAGRQDCGILRERAAGHGLVLS